MQTISIKIDGELYREIHIRAAEKGCSIKKYVTELIEQDLFPETHIRRHEQQLAAALDAVQRAEKALRHIQTLAEEQENNLPDMETPEMGEFTLG